jgi:hypothetical protein
VSVVGAAAFLIVVSAGPAGHEATRSTAGQVAERGTAGVPYRKTRPAPDIEVVLRAGPQSPIGPAGRSPLAVGKHLPLCQAIKGNRGQPVMSRGCGLPLLRPRPVQSTGLAIEARPPGFPLSGAALKAFVAGIGDAGERERATFLRRARQAEPTIDAAARRIASKQAEAVRADPELLSAAEQLRQATKRTVEGKLAQYSLRIRKYTTWLPGLRRYGTLVAVRPIYEPFKRRPIPVKRTYTGPWLKSRDSSGDGDDWDTSGTLQLAFSPNGDATNVTVHARAGFDSEARYEKYQNLFFDIPAGAGGEVEVEIDRSVTEASRLDDCFGFTYGSLWRAYKIYRIVRLDDGSFGFTGGPVVQRWYFTAADLLPDLTTCGVELPVPDPPALSPRAPEILRFEAPARGDSYMLVVYASADAQVVGGGTAVVEQDVAIDSVVVRYRG